MTEILNTTAGGTDGATVTTGNSGGASGQAFDNVQSSVTMTIVWDDDFDWGGGVTHGITFAGTGTRGVQWTTAFPTGAVAYLTQTCVIDTALPAAAFSLLNILKADKATVGASVRLNTTGHIELRAPTTIRFTSIAALAAGEKFRIRTRLASDATNGHIKVELFRESTGNLWGTVPDETIGNDTSNFNTGDGTVGGVTFGVVGDPGGTISFRMTALGASNTGQVAPLGTAPVTLDVPANFTLTPVAGERAITYSWVAVTAADQGYFIEQQKLVSGSFVAHSSVTVADPAITEFTFAYPDFNIEYGTTYQARIRALTADDN